MKNKKTIVCCIACIVLCITFFADMSKQNVSATSLSSITSKSIREKEEQIKKAQAEKKDLQSGLSNLKDIKKQLESQRTNLRNYVTQLDKSLMLIEQNIADLQMKIGIKEEEIQTREAQFEEALTKEENQKEAMVAHIRMVYETGEMQMIDMLLMAQGFGDLLNKADYVERVASYDQRMLQNYKTIKQYVDLCRQELELEKEILGETKAGVEEEQRNLEALIEQKTQDIIKYETDIDNREKAIREYEEEIKAEEEEIAALEALIAEEREKILADSGAVLTYDGGKFVFPIASYTRVSSEFGMRRHPTLGINKFHSGVDLAAPKGTAIYAAYDGVVAAASYSSSMGNYVMIDHGGSLFTIYMHASALYVKKGDVVIRGEKIAGVGTTGRSTGNHLHFGVRLNGEYVSPWNYISK